VGCWSVHEIQRGVWLRVGSAGRVEGVGEFRGGVCPLLGWLAGCFVGAVRGQQVASERVSWAEVGEVCKSAARRAVGKQLS